MRNLFLQLFCCFILNSMLSAQNCNHSAGTMSKDTFMVCIPNDSITLKNNNNQVLLPTDALMYVLHSYQDTTLGILYATSLTGFFDLSTLSLDTCQLYYVSAVVGQKMPNGLVDLNDTCLRIAEGTPFFRKKQLSNIVISSISITTCPAIVLCSGDGDIEACLPTIPNITIPDLFGNCNLRPTAWDTIKPSNTSILLGKWSIKEYPNAIIVGDTIKTPNYTVIFGDIHQPKTSIKVIQTQNSSLSFTCRFECFFPITKKWAVKKSCNTYVCNVHTYSDVPVNVVFLDVTGYLYGCDIPMDATMFVSGGDAPYSYHWSNGETTNPILILFTGTFSCTVTDSNGCSNVENLVAYIGSPIVDITAKITKPTLGQNNGSIELTANTFSIPNTYFWSTNQQTKTINITGLAAGTYNYAVTVVGAMGCETIENISITLVDSLFNKYVYLQKMVCDPSSLKADTIIFKPSVYYDSIVIVKKELKNASIWAKNQFTCNPAKVHSDTTFLKNLYGCDSLFIVNKVLKNSSVQATFRIKDYHGKGVSCINQKDGEIELQNIQNGVPPYQILWNNGSKQSLLTLLAAGTYKVTISDSEECAFEKTIILESPQKIDFQYELNQPHCNGEKEAQLNLMQLTGGTDDLFYSLNQKNKIKIANVPFSISNLLIGSHQLDISDANNCISRLDFKVESPKQKYLNESQEKQSILSGESTMLKIAPNFIAKSIEWTPSLDLSCDNCMNPIASPLETTNYEVIVHDEFGCELKSALKLNVLPVQNVFAPNVFHIGSVNNPSFTIYGNPLLIKKVQSLRIFDKWGEQVYANDNFLPNESGWDGTFKGKIAQEGVYTYIALVEFINAEVKKISGDVTLMK